MTLLKYSFRRGLRTICEQNGKTKNANHLKIKQLALVGVLEAGLEPARRLNAKGF